jgi:hypothetical protein
MTSTYLEDIAGFLQTNSLGTVGTDLFVNDWPDITDTVTPDLCTGIFSYAGAPSELTFTGRTILNPAFQIKVRSAARDQLSAIQRARDIAALLDGFANQTLGDNYYLLIQARGEISFIGRDQSQRPEFVQNYGVMMSP